MCGCPVFLAAVDMNEYRWRDDLFQHDMAFLLIEHILWVSYTSSIHRAHITVFAWALPHSPSNSLGEDQGWECSMWTKQVNGVIVDISLESWHGSPPSLDPNVHYISVVWSRNFGTELRVCACVISRITPAPRDGNPYYHDMPKYSTPNHPSIDADTTGTSATWKLMKQ